MNVTAPAATPVTTPAFVIVATEGSLLVHVPSVPGVSVIVLPAHTTAGPPSTGGLLTVRLDVVLEHPVAVSVKVKVTVPALTALTMPSLVIVATAVLLLTQLPPVEGEKL